ncbi:MULTISPECIES: DMT family transporter [unclassified Photobacterium]|uniref:DMT family transporter n=1 Tax=unclassified Photobacterium TaxID=2628852 RepID=UPI001EDF0B35|nr:MULTISPECIES: DMT family transporter [unclassified Photobacterium]MCG3864758.1 DMT family transporter [Photobacterium sp. Ph6]MCG3876167.1 DMT family transporter [Photobacterium sp. Ph5]
MTTSNESLIPLGARFMLLSALGFALMSSTVKYVSQIGIPVFEIVAARAVVSLIISYLDIKRKSISVWGNNKPLLVVRGIVGTIGLSCVYYAVTTLPLAEATILQYTNPVFTALLAVIFLKERVQFSTLVCIALSILGLFFIVNPTTLTSGSSHLPLFSVMIALIGAFVSAVSYIIVKKLSSTEDSSVIIFYFPLITLPLSLLLITDNFVVPDFSTTICLILVGIFTQIGQVGLTKAMQTQTAGKATAYSYVQIVLSIIFGFIIFKEVPSIWTYIGGVLIIAGAIVNLFGHNIMKKIKRTRH